MKKIDKPLLYDHERLRIDSSFWLTWFLALNPQLFTSLEGRINPAHIKDRREQLQKKVGNSMDFVKEESVWVS